MRATEALDGLSITQLAARAIIRPYTIRYYERLGLLPASARTAGNHRRYDDCMPIGAKETGRAI